MYICAMDKYKINKDGTILNVKRNRGLKQHVDKYGYSRVNLWVNGKVTQKQVHRLVAIEHIENPNNKPQVNHIDGDKSNNNAQNLEWVTNQENRDHAVRLGLHKHQKYEVYKKGVLCGIFNGSKQVADNFNLDQSAVCKVANGHYKTTKGYEIWKTD